MNLKNDQRGNSSTLAIVGLTILLLIFIVFSFWAFSGRQKYKNNVQAISDQAAQQAVQVAQQQDAVKYNEQLKNPYRSYSGPSQYGGISLKYPNTWSSYIDDSGNGQALIDGYFNPGHVPSISAQSSVFALRVQVLNQPYSDVLNGITSLTQQNQAKISPYSLPLLPSVVGVKVTGQIANNQTGEMVVLPLRGYTVEIFTMGNDHQADFENIILPNFTFSP